MPNPRFSPRNSNNESVNGGGGRGGAKKAPNPVPAKPFSLNPLTCKFSFFFSLPPYPASIARDTVAGGHGARERERERVI